MLKKKIENSNVCSRFLLNWVFYACLIIWIIFSIFLIIWNLIPSTKKESINAIISIFMSFLGLSVAYHWGNFSYMKEKRIKIYINDIKKTKINLEKIIDNFKEEFIYQ